MVMSWPERDAVDVYAVIRRFVPLPARTIDEPDRSVPSVHVRILSVRQRAWLAAGVPRLTGTPPASS